MLNRLALIVVVAFVSIPVVPEADAYSGAITRICQLDMDAGHFRRLRDLGRLCPGFLLVDPGGNRAAHASGVPLLGR